MSNKFIHKSVRLNTFIEDSIRYFTLETKMKKWLDDVYIDDTTYKISDKIVGSIEEISDHRVVIKLEEGFLTINFMQCTYKTEYCTEIHIIHEIDDKDMSLFWDMKLDDLRRIFNKDWIIQDEELTLSILTGGI